MRFTPLVRCRGQDCLRCKINLPSHVLKIGREEKLRSSPSLCGSQARRKGIMVGYCSAIIGIEGLQRSTNGEHCNMTKKLDVGKALDKLRGGDEPNTNVILLDKKIRSFGKSSAVSTKDWSTAFSST